MFCVFPPSPGGLPGGALRPTNGQASFQPFSDLALLPCGAPVWLGPSYLWETEPSSLGSITSLLAGSQGREGHTPIKLGHGPLTDNAGPWEGNVYTRHVYALAYTRKNVSCGACCRTRS